MEATIAGIRQEGMSREARTVFEMARKLASDVARLEHRATLPPPETFPRYKDVRAAYLEIQGLLYTIGERTPRIAVELPADFSQWIVRIKLRALAAFTTVSVAFLQNPPLAMTQAIGARDVLLAEQANFSEALAYFDAMLMEAGIDDQIAEALDATRVSIEWIIGRLGELLLTSPESLPEF